MPLDRFKAFSSQIEAARQSGYSDEEIEQFLLSRPDLMRRSPAGVGETLKTAGRGLLSAAADVFPATVGRTIRGGDISTEEGAVDRWISENEAERQARSLSEGEAERPSAIPGLTLGNIERGLQNLGYSGASMVGGMAAGATVGSAIPGAGTLAGAVGGALGAGAAGAGVGFRASKDQFVESVFNNLRQSDPALTEEKWQGVREAIENDADLYGFWEAAPEAVGNMLTVGIIKTPVAKFLKDLPFIKNQIAKTITSGAVKTTANVGQEIATEGVTAVKQGGIEQRHGLRTDAPQSWAEGMREVAPETTVMAAATMGLGSVANGLLSRKRAEVQDKGRELDHLSSAAIATISRPQTVLDPENWQDAPRAPYMGEVIPGREPTTPGEMVNLGNEALASREQDFTFRDPAPVPMIRPQGLLTRRIEALPEAVPIPNSEGYLALPMPERKRLPAPTIDVTPGGTAFTSGQINRMVNGRLQPQEARGGWSDDVILRESGKPFATRKSAELFARSRKLGDFEVVGTDADGFGVRKIDDPFNLDREAAIAESVSIRESARGAEKLVIDGFRKNAQISANSITGRWYIDRDYAAKEVSTALQKYGDGGRLGPKQQEIVDAWREDLERRQNALDITGASFNEDSYASGFGATERKIYEAYHAAKAIDENAADAIMEKDLADGEVLSRLIAIAEARDGQIQPSGIGEDQEGQAVGVRADAQTQGFVPTDQGPTPAQKVGEDGKLFATPPTFGKGEKKQNATLDDMALYSEPLERADAAKQDDLFATPPASPEAKPEAKQPWEMTKEEYDNQIDILYNFPTTKNNLAEAQPFIDRKTADGTYPPEAVWSIEEKGREKRLVARGKKTRSAHNSVVRKALSEGKPVPAEVLKDYPELVKPADSPKPLQESSNRESGNPQQAAVSALIQGKRSPTALIVTDPSVKMDGYVFVNGGTKSDKWQTVSKDGTVKVTGGNIVSRLETLIREGKTAEYVAGEAEKKADIPGPQDAKPGQIYQTRIKRGEEVVTMYAVPEGDKPAFGDEIYPSLEEAREAQEAKAKRKAANEEYRAKVRAEEEKKQARIEKEKAEIENRYAGFVEGKHKIQAATIKNNLEKRVNHNGKVKSRAQMIEDLVAQGYRIEEAEFFDQAAHNKAEAEYKQLAKTAPIGNENHPETKRYRELKSIVKDLSSRTTERRLVLDDSLYSQTTVTKTGMDYAEYLIARQEPTKPVAEKAAEPKAAETKPAPKEETKEPWQMTAKEWEAARAAVRPEVVQSNFTKASASQATANAKGLELLLYGVTDEASRKIKDAAAGKIKLSAEELEEATSRLETKVRHKDVVEKALREGKDVPAEVLAEYPEFETRETDKGTAMYAVKGVPGSLPLDSHKGFETGKPVTFNFVHNTESATGIFGKPKKDSPHNRWLEPSGRYVTQVDSTPGELPKNLISGSLTFNNPLVLKGENWKKDLSAAFGNKRGKALSRAIIDAGFDGVVTIDEGRQGKYISETLDLTTFDEAKAKYATSPAPDAVTDKTVRAAFPTATKIDHDAADEWRVHLPNGASLTVKTGEHIKIDEAAYQKGYGESARGKTAVGEFRSIDTMGIIRLAKEAGSGTLDHEILHSAIALALNENQRKVLLSKYKTEEAAAKAYEEWTPGKGNSFFQRIYDFFRNLLNLYKPKTVESIFRDIKSGKVWQQKGEGAQGGQPQYATVGPVARENPYAEENKRIREKHKTVWEKAGKMLRRQLFPGGLLPDSVFKEKITRDSEFNVIEFDVRHLVGNLDRDVKRDFGMPYEKLPEEVKAKITESLGGKVDGTLPEGTRAVLVAMRRYIDDLSTDYAGILFAQAKELGARGKDAVAAARADLLNTIAGNIGQYVHRSYRAFDDKNWFKKVSDETLNDAREYLRDRYEAKGETAEESARLTEVVISEILKNGTAYDSMEGMIKESKLGAKDLSVLKHRKDIAPQIRALLGEYTDARVNFAKTATKMGRLIWNQRFLDKVRGLGMGQFLFEGTNRPPDATAQIATDGSETYSPLNGLWTYPEIDQAFKDALGKEKMANWYRGVIQANGMVKFGKTVLSPTTAARNWQSAMFFSLANGHFNLSHMTKSLSGLREYFTQQGSGAKLEYLRKLQHLGVVYDTPYAGEMMKLLEDSRLDETMLAGKVTLRNALGYAQKFYQFGDDFWKIIGFENEKANLVGAGMSETAAEKEAAERIRNTYPTYSMTGKFVRGLRRFPLAGTFVSFPAEIIRTQANILKYIARDLKDPKRAPLARKRIAGMAISAGMIYGLQSLTRAWFDIDEDEDEAVRQLSAPWNRNSNFLYLGRDENGGLRYIDLSFVDPYNYFKRPLTAILRGQPWEDKFSDVMKETLEPFLGTDIAAGAIFEVVANKREGTGSPIYKENDLPQNQIAAIANHLRKNLQPGIVSNLERTWKAIDGQVSPSGKKYTLEDEASAWVGWRVTSLDPKTSLYYRTFEFQDAKNDATSGLYRTIRSRNDVSASDLRESYETTTRLREKAYRGMYRLTTAAQKSGLSKSEILQILRSSQVPMVDAMAILRGDVPKWRPTPQRVRDDARKAQQTFEGGRKILGRYNQLRKIINEN